LQRAADFAVADDLAPFVEMEVAVIGMGHEASGVDLAPSPFLTVLGRPAGRPYLLSGDRNDLVSHVRPAALADRVTELQAARPCRSMFADQVRLLG